MAQLKEFIAKKKPVNIAHTAMDVSIRNEAGSTLGKQKEAGSKSELQQMLDSDEWHTIEEARQLSLKHIDEAWRK